LTSAHSKSFIHHSATMGMFTVFINFFRPQTLEQVKAKRPRQGPRAHRSRLDASGVAGCHSLERYNEKPRAANSWLSSEPMAHVCRKCIVQLMTFLVTRCAMQHGPNRQENKDGLVQFHPLDGKELCRSEHFGFGAGGMNPSQLGLAPNTRRLPAVLVAA
jgi:hypothetical protein